MANTYFQFKQFRINQGQTAMKVTTEGCLLGGWAAGQVSLAHRVLDIGAGTGLLSLMLAQRLTDATLFAVEIDREAAQQASQNFQHSPWSNRLFVLHEKAQDISFSEKFDLIISNPPFYKKSLNSPSPEVNLARHDDSLSQSELLQVIISNLSANGMAYLLYPVQEAEDFKQLARAEGLYLQRELSVSNQPSSGAFRVIMTFGMKEVALEKSTLSIRQANGAYTADFIKLLSAYYLYL